MTRPLAATHFVLIGAGGLGGPLAYALAAAGARALTVCDPDIVELSNLQRQVQFTTADIGAPKVTALAAELGRRGYHRTRALPVRFEAATAAEILADGDVVIDGSDSLVTKFAVSDALTRRGLLGVIAGVLRYSGQVMALAPGRACYRCIFEEVPDDDDAQSCAHAGVLGAAVAIIAGHAALAALALARGDARDAGTLLSWNDVRRCDEPRRLAPTPRPACPACSQASGWSRQEAS